tara:strand:+ start:469 stop:678 length:210 start_codon:yes stop_codon:yes gene_type:complete
MVGGSDMRVGTLVKYTGCSDSNDYENIGIVVQIATKVWFVPVEERFNVHFFHDSGKVWIIKEYLEVLCE